MQLQEKFTNALSDILGFEVEIKDDKVKINQWLDFGSYKINNWFKKDFEEVLQKAIDDIEKLGNDNEKVYKWVLDFFALYYKGGDFGYFKSRFDSFKYRIPYSGKDTEFTWSTKDSYFVKTKDVENTIKVGFFEDEIEFLKKDDEEKENNEIEVIKEDNKIKVIFYNWKRYKNGQRKEISESELKELKEKLEKEGINIQIDKNFKQLLNDFLKKWGKDYFIHQKLKAFLLEELAYFVYQKISLEEYIFVKKKAILDFVNEILDLKEKDVLTEQQEEVKKLFDEIQDTDDIYRYYENLQKIKNIIILSSQVEGERIKLEDVLNFERFEKLKEKLEEKKEVLETILQENTKKIIETFEQVIKDFIEILSQIEEIKKLIWETKKAVVKANYVVSIDKILEAGGDKNFVLGLITQGQIDEWKDELKLVEEGFKEEDIFEDEKYLKLPIDTQYLDENKKFELLSLFDDLEEKLDGLLIKSENFQALKTIQDKYKEQVKTIYIDPPYNTLNDGFVYKDNYNHSSWLSMMENRLRLAKELMREDGGFFTSLGDTKEDIRESHRYTFLQDIIFGDKNYINQIAVKVKSSAGVSGGGEDSKLKKNKEWLFFYAKDKELLDFNKPIEWQEIDFNDFDYTKVLLKKGERKLIAGRLKDKTILSWKEIKQKGLEKEVEIKIYEYTGYEIKSIAELVKEKLKQLKKEKSKLSKEEEKIFKEIFKKEVILENLDKFFTSFKAQSSIYEDIVSYFGKEGMVGYEYKPISGKDKGKLIENLIYNGRLVDFAGYRYKIKNGKLYKKEEIGDMWVENWWQGIGPEGGIDFNNAKKPEKFIKRIMDINNTDYILDFFAGSGTTCAVAQKMGKKWIGIEINQYFDTTILARLKRVLFCEQSGISKEVNWQGGGFFKYIYLDQYDEILERLDFKDFETNFNEEKDKKKAKKENFDKKIIYIYNQIINGKKEKDLINTAIYHFNFKEQRYYHNKDYTLVETDKSYILKIKTNNLNSLAENLDDKKTIYTSKEDYEKLSDKLKIKVKVLDYLFNYSV